MKPFRIRRFSPFAIHRENLSLRDLIEGYVAGAYKPGQVVEHTFTPRNTFKAVQSGGKTTVQKVLEYDSVAFPFIAIGEFDNLSGIYLHFRTAKAGIKCDYTGWPSIEFRGLSPYPYEISVVPQLEHLDSEFAREDRAYFEGLEFRAKLYRPALLVNSMMTMLAVQHDEIAIELHIGGRIDDPDCRSSILETGKCPGFAMPWNQHVLQCLPLGVILRRVCARITLFKFETVRW